MKKVVLSMLLISNFIFAVNVGDYVTKWYDKNKDSKWAGTVVQKAGDKIKVEVTKVNCNSGGLFGICIQFNEGTCTGHRVLENGNTYTIWVPEWCVE